MECLRTWILTSAAVILRQVTPRTCKENSALRGNPNSPASNSLSSNGLSLGLSSKFFLRDGVTSAPCCSLKEHGCLWCTKVSPETDGWVGPQRAGWDPKETTQRAFTLISFLQCRGCPSLWASEPSFVNRHHLRGMSMLTMFSGMRFVNHCKGEVRLLSRLDVDVGRINRLHANHVIRFGTRRLSAWNQGLQTSDAESLKGWCTLLHSEGLPVRGMATPALVGTPPSLHSAWHTLVSWTWL